MNKWINLLNRYSFYLGLIIVIIQLSPIFILGKDVYFTIWDGLEYISMYEYIAKSGYLFADNNIILPHLMNGLPRVSFPTEWNVTVWLFYFFEPFYAYSLTIIIIHIVAFLGMRIFIKNHILSFVLENNEDKMKYNFLVDFSALYFALLPHWPLGGLSIAGMPLLVNSFLNFIKYKNTYKDWLCIILFPFYSDFVFSNLFVIIFLFIIGLVQLLKEKKINLNFWAVLFVFAIISGLLEYRLFLSVIQKFESHRSLDEISTKPMSLIKLFSNFDLVIKSYQDAPVKAFPFVLTTVLFSIIVTYLSELRKIFWSLFLLFTIVLLFSYSNYLKLYFVALLSFEPSVQKLLSGLNLRFYVINPFLWGLLYSGSILTIYYVYKNSKAFIFSSLIIVLNVFFLLFTTGTTYCYSNSNGLESTLSNNIKKPHPTYREYFDYDLFDNIKKFILETYNLKTNQYRIISINDSDSNYPVFSCMVPFANGFYNLDGYCVYYPKKYKEKFLELIKYRGNINNKVYVPFDYENHKLDINFELFKQINGKFIFSAVEIIEPKDKIKLVKIFNGLYWKIYLYEVL